MARKPSPRVISRCNARRLRRFRVSATAAGAEAWLQRGVRNAVTNGEIDGLGEVIAFRQVQREISIGEISEIKTAIAGRTSFPVHDTFGIANLENDAGHRRIV